MSAVATCRALQARTPRSPVRGTPPAGSGTSGAPACRHARSWVGVPAQRDASRAGTTSSSGSRPPRRTRASPLRAAAVRGRACPRRTVSAPASGRDPGAMTCGPALCLRRSSRHHARQASPRRALARSSSEGRRTRRDDDVEGGAGSFRGPAAGAPVAKAPAPAPLPTASVARRPSSAGEAPPLTGNPRRSARKNGPIRQGGRRAGARPTKDTSRAVVGSGGVVSRGGSGLGVSSHHRAARGVFTTCCPTHGNAPCAPGEALDDRCMSGRAHPPPGRIESSWGAAPVEAGGPAASRPRVCKPGTHTRSGE
jgi:hypothetical protein